MGVPIKRQCAKCRQWRLVEDFQGQTLLSHGARLTPERVEVCRHCVLNRRMFDRPLHRNDRTIYVRPEKA